VLVVIALPLGCCGCPALSRLPTQAAVMELTEERTHRPYLLYVPSTYSDKLSWPLVVACHGTRPYDGAASQMKEWAKFAEDRGIVVAAPNLSSVRGDFPPPPQKQIARQREDEQAILAIVSVLKRRYNIAEERVFMTGWSAGAYPILDTGLRNPDVFRALAIRQGTFDDRFMDVPPDRIDRWQRILVIYGMADFLRGQSKALIKWLRDAGLTVDEREIAGSHRRIGPELPWRFFRDVIRKTPWVRIRVGIVDPYEPRTLRFRLDAIPQVNRQKWFFGDGGESYDASPVHAYARPGRYEVTVNVALANGIKYPRRRVIRVE
jgi:predicted esterase